jgi:hypothetical protein
VAQGCHARPGCVHVMLVQKVSWCMQRLHLQVILLLCLESAILLPLNYIRATGAHKPRQNGEPRQPRHLDTSTASTPTSTPRHHPHMESAFTNLDRPRHKPRHRLDRGSTASTPRQPGLCDDDDDNDDDDVTTEQLLQRYGPVRSFYQLSLHSRPRPAFTK